MSEAMPALSGPLGEVRVPDVRRSLAAAGRTGLLQVHGGDQRLVALAGGEVYLATSASGPSLHQILVGSGAVPEEAWTAATAVGHDIAAHLDDDHRVDSERLRSVLEEHAVATVVELLAPGPERYEFLDEATHQLGPRYRFPVEVILTEADRRLDTWRSTRGGLDTSTLVRRAATLAPGVTVASVTAVEWQVLATMPERATVAEVIAVSGLSAFTVFDVLHRLVARRLVQPLAPASDPRG